MVTIWKPAQVDGPRHHPDVHEEVDYPALDVAFMLVHRNLQGNVLYRFHTDTTTVLLCTVYTKCQVHNVRCTLHICITSPNNVH